MSHTVKIIHWSVVIIVACASKTNGEEPNLETQYDENWQVCVLSDQNEQDNMDALEEYLNDMNFC